MKTKIKTMSFAVQFLIGVNLCGYAPAQVAPPKEVVTENMIVSFVKETPFQTAMRSLSEISSRLLHKIIVDPAQRTTEIGINIDNLPWRTALELIAAENGATLVETDTYILLSGVTTDVADPVSIQETGQQTVGLKPISYGLREIKISATFFEADRSMLREIGINWGVFSEKGNTVLEAEQNVVGDKTPEDIGTFGFTHTARGTGVNMLIKALEGSNVGEVIANPSITVMDGRVGRVQIGQDFSIKQRDFAGNVTDEFVSSGIILNVTPVIYVEDSVQFIHLKVEVERSSVIPGTVSTIINKTEATTDLLLNDGEKAAIGGLFLTEETRIRKGIPYLKNIPKWFFGLGYIFGYDFYSKSEKELIIFLKADIVPTLEERRALMVSGGLQ